MRAARNGANNDSPLAWRFLMFQKESALAVWYRARTADSGSGTRKTMIVALARKLVIALWRFVTTGEPLAHKPRRSRPNLRPRSRSALVIDRLLKNQNPSEIVIIF